MSLEGHVIRNQAKEPDQGRGQVVSPVCYTEIRANGRVSKEVGVRGQSGCLERERKEECH